MSSAIAKLTLKMMPLASVLGFGTSLYLIKEQLYFSCETRDFRTGKVKRYGKHEGQ
jgi:hypothetical protein